MNEELIKRYLLGKISDEEREKVEQRQMIDNEFSKQLELAEEELVDDYVHARLSDDEQKSFERCFLSTPEGQRQVEFARDLVRYASRAANKEVSNPHNNLLRPGFWKNFWWNPKLRLALAALLVVCLGVGAWSVFFYRSPVDKGLVALNEAYSSQRPTQARISGFGYAPWLTIRGDEPDRSDHRARDRAEKILHDAAAEDAGPASHHALGKLYLARREYNEAIDLFREALAGDPSNAQLHSDLGAALLEMAKANQTKGDSEKSFEELAESLNHLNKAIELDSSLLEALFNRALLYQEMMLLPRAEEDWKQYPKKDQNSEWAEEAKRNLKQIEEQKERASQKKEQLFQSFIEASETLNGEAAWKALSQSYYRPGNYITEKLVDDYLSLKGDGQKDESSLKLELLNFAAKLQAQKTGDLYISDLARFYGAIPTETQAHILKAREMMKTGHAHVAETRFDDGFESYSTAKQIFDGARDECESKVAQYWMGVCDLQRDNMERGFSTLRSLADSCEEKSYKWLVVRSLNRLADHQFTINEYSNAIDYSRRSLELAEQIEDTYGMYSALSQLTEEHRYIGNYRQSLRYINRSLALASVTAPEPNQAWLNYDAAAWTLDSLGYYAAASDYEKVALGYALELGENLMICLSYIRLAIIDANLQNYGEGLNNVQQAFNLAESSLPQPASSQMMAYSLLYKGNIYQKSGDASKAIDSYNRSIEIYQTLNSPTFLYQVHKARLSSYIALGNTSLVREELETAINLYKSYWASIVEESNRDSFVDSEHDVFDLGMDYEYTVMKDVRKAFEYSEISRARSLLDLRRASPQLVNNDYGPELTFSSSTPPFTLAEIQERLPVGVQILEYALLEHKILIWIISKTEIHSVEQEVRPGELNEKIRRFLSLVARPRVPEEQEVRQLGMDLYDLLIRRAEPYIDSNKQLCIIPDKIINYIPFNALITPETGDYLIENYELIVSPSASVFLDCTDTAKGKALARKESLLSVGNPQFDRESFPEFHNLPSAAREAQEIAAYYDSPHSFIAHNARESQVAKLMRDSDVIHFAMHSVINDASPMRSKLLLARESQARSSESTDGLLEAHEIYAMKTLQARLVVLSACQTGVGYSYRGEGVISIARPFIAVGVPVVVASYWSVDTASTAELMINFHKYRKRNGQSTAHALRQAQRDMIHGSEHYRHPYYWASFGVFGGYAEF